MASQSYQLTMRTGPMPGKVFDLDKGEMTVGRDAGNDLVVNDSEISRKHARLLRQAGGYVLEDLGSTNGTFVNGQRLMGPHVLRPGETLMFGENVSMVFGVGYDADATMVSAAAVQPQAYQPQAHPPQAYQPPVQPQAAYQPQQRPVAPQAYTGQIPYGPPAQVEEEEEGGRNFKPLIYAGCGCLLVVVCLVVGAVAFDWLDLYCTGPFSVLEPLYSMWGGTCQ
ncbi:MAG: FHA domain-containing protein [Chloroflexi bacterium]|nr:FHA domain-containing protein [Chloroflexota bacterium]